MNLATTPSMETEPNKPSQGEQLANVLRRCMAGIATSRAEAEHALQRLEEVQSVLDKLVGMAEKGSPRA